jgi:predicted anti-sigma-YlaC factor YlaD
MPEAGDTKGVYRRITWLLVLVNLSVPAFVFFQRNGNDLGDTKSIWIGWISASLLTTVLVISTYLRLPLGRRRIPKSIVLTSLALVVLSGIITTVSISATPSDNYLAVALSDTPLNSIKPDRKRLMVELIREEKAASDENSRIAHSMKPISPALYSVESFANKAAMESTSSQLKQAYDIDQTYAMAKLKARRAFHDKMQKVDPAFLRGVETKMQEEDSTEALIEEDEAKWVSSALSLYDYTATHASNISVNSSGHLTITNEELKRSLLQQVETSKALQQTMINDRTKALNSKHSLQDAMGVKHSE